MKACHLRLGFVGSSTLFYFIASLPTMAQIVPDATLPNNSLVIQQGNTSVIEGGTQAGGNLFHSFSEFSIPTGGEAFFNNAIDIQNIFSRVTGSSISNIDGLIRANGVANLFLLNPNGIIFGPHAQLNIGGSFLASTASSVRFADGTFFDTTNPQTAPLLTISVPVGLQMGPGPALIEVRGPGHNLSLDRETGAIIKDNRPVGLQVAPGQTLALLGGRLFLDGGNLTAEGGRIELGSVGRETLVTLTPINRGIALSYPDIDNFGNIWLSRAASVDVSGAGGGDVFVAGQMVTLTDGSAILALTEGGKAGGTLSIRASQGVEAIGTTPDRLFPSGLFTQVQPGATGDGGNVTIETARLWLFNGAQVSAVTFGPGKAGSLTVKVTDAIELNGISDNIQFPLRGGLFAQANPGATGDGGNLTIETTRLRVERGAQVSTVTASPGKGGNLTVKATDTVELIGTGSGLFVTAESGATGEGGNLTIETPRLQVVNEAQVLVLPAVSPIVPDATLPNNSLVFQQGNTSFIAGGTQVGGNLFHSFREFSVPTDGEVMFNNGGDIQNIFSRVTGGSISNIDGWIRTNGTANLFLLNPNGIIFGPNALLDLGGSFLASTASGIGFADGTFWSNANPQATPLLTTSVPIGLQFGPNPGSIVVQSWLPPRLALSELYLNLRPGLPVPPFPPVPPRGHPLRTDVGLQVQKYGATLALVASGVALENGRLEADRIEIGSVSGPSLVSLTPIEQGWTLGYEGVQNFQDIQLYSFSDIPRSPRDFGTSLRSSINGRYIHLRGRQIRLTQDRDPAFFSNSPSSLIQGNNLILTASDLVEASGRSALSAASFLTITARRLVVRDGASLRTTGYYLDEVDREPKPSVLTINASESVEVNQGILSTSQGTVGNLSIQTRNLIVNNGGQISAATTSDTPGGNVSIKATESVEVSGSATTTDGRLISEFAAGSGIAFIDAKTGETLISAGKGPAGNIQIETGRLIVNDGARVTVNSLGSGEAGSITVKADSILLDNAANLTANTAGGGGEINLRTPALILRRGSSITTNATGSEIPGGNITMALDTGVLAALENSDITANSKDFRGGQVRINAQSIFGTQFRPIGTPESSDITATGATSDLSGTVQINTPEVDPSSGLIQLPQELVDTTRLVDKRCSPQQQQSSFIVTGRGGLPTPPNEPLNPDSPWEDWRIAQESQPIRELNSQNSRNRQQTTNQPPETIVEAQGWYKDANGNIVLTAEANSVTPHGSWFTYPNCQP